MIQIDKASILCIDKRWDERNEDILNAHDRLTAIGVDFEIFMAKTDYGVFDDPVQYDYFDVSKEEVDVSRWGYGREGYKHHHWNAFQCHHQMIQRAVDEGRENLLILEDDSYLTSRFEDVWKAICQKELDYNILYLGWWCGSGDENDTWNQQVEQQWNENGIINLMKSIQVGGLHGALINKNMFDFILNLPANNPIDCQLNQHHANLHNWVILPKIIHTRSTMSFCEGNIITRKHL